MTRSRLAATVVVLASSVALGACGEESDGGGSASWDPGGGYEGRAVFTVADTDGLGLTAEAVAEFEACGVDSSSKNREDITAGILTGGVGEAPKSVVAGREGSLIVTTDASQVQLDSGELHPVFVADCRPGEPVGGP